ncbi:MAG: SPOR domain-containing protein, partial [Bacteroidota bacterium]
ATEMVSDTILLNTLKEEKKNIGSVENNEAKTNSEGRFLVVAASFNTLELAEQEQKRLARLGYNNSEIGYFNQRKIVSVIIGRYDDYATADAIAKEMKAKHKVDAYVHRKR